jgi:hypothetical protein
MKRVFAYLGFIALLTSVSVFPSQGITKFDLQKVWEIELPNKTSRISPELSGNKVIFSRSYFEKESTCPRKTYYHFIDVTTGKEILDKPLSSIRTLDQACTFDAYNGSLLYLCYNPIAKENEVYFTLIRKNIEDLSVVWETSVKAEEHSWGMDPWHYEILDGKIFLNSGVMMYSLSFEDGKVLWKKDNTGLGTLKILGKLGEKVICLREMFGSKKNEYRYSLYIFSENTGEIIWESEELTGFKRMHNRSFSFDDKYAFVSNMDYNVDDETYESKLACIDIQTGKILWRRDYDTTLAYIIVRDDHLYVSVNKKTYCLEPGTGKEIWSIEWLDEFVGKNDGKLLFLSSFLKDTQLIIIEPKDGSQIATIPVGKDYGLFTYSYCYKDGLFFFDDDQKAYCYKLTQMPDPPAPKEIRLEFRIGSKEMKINSVTKQIDSAPVIINSRTYLPARHILEPLGGTIEWDSKEKKVTCKLPGESKDKAEDTIIEFWVGNPKAKINGQAVQIDPNDSSVMTCIVGGRTLAPMRFIGENLGCAVEWIQSNASVILTRKQ